MTWLAGWSKRKSHVINAQAGAGTLYQKQITVHYSTSISKLTLLNERSAKVFTILATSDWTEQTFGSTVPANTVVALCMLKFSTTNDLYFKSTSTSTIKTLYSVGSSAKSFNGSIFALVPVANQKTWSQNIGASGAVDVYVVGYFVKDNDGDFYFEMFSQDNQVITNGVATAWTDIDISGLKVEDGGLQIKGAVIALDCATSQSVYFRAKGSSDAGVLWETDTNNPAPHFIGFIPVSSAGVFQYKTSAGGAINVYAEGLIHTASASQSDNLRIETYNKETVSVIGDSAWHTYTPTFDAKVYGVHFLHSPNAMGTFKVRPTGGTNAQIYGTKDSCGIFYLPAPKGTGGSIDYWSNEATSVSLFVGSISIVSHESVSEESVGGDVYCQCRTDFGDIRFTDDGGSTELDYWMESKTDGDNAVFWVEISGDLSTVAKTIYIYYDKPDATTTSNGDNTFLFFDDFNDSSINTTKWNISGSPVESGGILDTNNVVCNVRQKTTLFNTSVALRIRGGVTGQSAYASYLGFANAAVSKFLFYPHATYGMISYDGGITSTQDTATTPYHIFEIRWLSSSSVKYSKDDGSITEHTTHIPTDDMGVIIGAGNVGYKAVSDWVLMRKCIAIEPVHSTWGTEEAKEAMVTGKIFVIDKDSNVFRIDPSSMIEEKKLVVV